MKKLLCLFFSCIIIISLCSCNTINNDERVSVEETEERFNEIVTEIKKCIKDKNIILYQEPFESFEDGFGTIDFAFNYGRIQFGINIHNDRFNLFGNDFENGVEKYNIEYCRYFNQIDKVLDTDNGVFEIMPVVLSNVLGEPVSKVEIIELMNKVKNNYCNSITDNKKTDILVDYKSKFKGGTFEYTLYNRTSDSGYREGISFYGITK